MDSIWPEIIMPLSLLIPWSRPKVDSQNRIVGYVLAKMEEDESWDLGVIERQKRQTDG